MVASTSLAEIKNWRHPFMIEGQCVPLEKDWFKDWHNWRWSVDRPIIDAALGGFSGHSILDVGCQDGWYSLQAARCGAEVLGIDLREEAIKRANLMREHFNEKRASFIVGNVEDAQTVRGTFDGVINYGLLYHLADPITVMRKLGKVSTRIMAVQTFVHAMDRAPVLHLLKEGVDLPGKGATELITTPSMRAVFLMFKEAGFDHVYKNYPINYRRRVKHTGSNGYWQWTFWYGVKGEPLRETEGLRLIRDGEVPKNHFGIASQVSGLARARARRYLAKDVIGGF